MTYVCPKQQIIKLVIYFSFFFFLLVRVCVSIDTGIKVNEEKKLTCRRGIGRTKAKEKRQPFYVNQPTYNKTLATRPELKELINNFFVKKREREVTATVTVSIKNIK